MGLSSCAEGGGCRIRGVPSTHRAKQGLHPSYHREEASRRRFVHPKWYGETVGFWDGDKLITLTANIQGWTVTHALFEYSCKLETIEIILPRPDANGALRG